MTRDEQTLRIVFVRLRKTGNVFHLFNAREYFARHIIFTYKYRARAMRRPRVKGGVVKVSGVPARILIWWVCIYNATCRQVYLSVVFVRNFQPLQALQPLQSLQALQALQPLQALQALQVLKALQALQALQALH